MSNAPAVVIVGSGPAGVSAAWPMVKAGVRVLMVDASLRQSGRGGPSGDIETFRHDADRWKEQFGPDLSGLSPTGNISPKLTTPLARSIVARFTEGLPIKTKNFFALGSLEQGGLSNIWGAVVAAYNERDLKRFPIRLPELMPSYHSVMRRIGVSGPGAADGFSMDEGPPLTRPLKHVFDAYKHNSPTDDFALTQTTNAVLMKSRDGRQDCKQCGLCLWGCRRNSIYNSALEVPKLLAFPNFSYRSDALVDRVVPAEGGHGLIINAATSPELIVAPRVILAAGTISTTFLVLRRLGQAGRPCRLLTNPVGAIAFIVPRLIGAALPLVSFALGQLSYEVPLSDTEFGAGVLFGVDTLPLIEVADRLPFTRPTALRLSRALAPALILANIYLPGHYSQNFMHVEQAEGTSTLVIEGFQPEQIQTAIRLAGKRLARGMRRLGAIAIPRSISFAPPGADAHYGGTLPMGGGGDLGCSIDGELYGLPGLYVADGAVLPDLPAKHCTLTIMANADRIAQRLAQRLTHSPMGPG